MERTTSVQINIPPLPRSQATFQSASQSQPARHQNAGFKTLSVDKALQYTPLTTSVLPAHDRILIPQITRSRETAKLTSSQERKVVQQTIAQCPAAKVTERLRSLLVSELLPEYKFKQTPVTEERTHNGVHSSTQPDLGLSPVARMVLEMTNVDYIFPSKQIKPDVTQPILRPAHGQQSPAPSTPKPAQFMRPPNAHVFAGPKGEPPPVSKPSSGTLVINVPKRTPNSQPPVFDATPGSPKRRKLSHDEKAIEKPRLEISLHVKSQREAADTTLSHFQNYLLEIFEAQDLLDAGSTSVHETGFFDPVEDGDDSEPTLSNKTMEKLQTDLKKLIDMKRLSDMSSEHLRRLQRLCEPSIDRAQTVNLRLPANADSSDQDQWRQNIHKAERGLLSGIVCLYTVLGASQDESLMSTEALTWIPSALTNIFENCIIPCVEARGDGPDLEFFKAVVTCRDDVRRLLEHSRKAFDITSAVCTTVRGAESGVNPIEFLAAKLIFVQNATADKNSALGVQVFEKVRKTAMSGLARIFARYPAERSAILDEVLTSLDKLPSNSRSARQYRLGEGKSIQLISALFMQLVQNTSLDTSEQYPKPKRRAAGKGLDELDEDAEDGAEDAMHLVEDQLETTREDALTRVRHKGNGLFDVAAKSAQEIVMYLVGRASKTTKTGDSPYRNVLDLFIEDMVSVLPSPEWPSSELMLRIMAAKMIDVAQHDKTASAKSMALESLGTMGSAISALKASLSRHGANLTKEGRTKSQAAVHLSKLASDQDQGALRNEDLVAFDGPFAIVSRHLWTEAHSSPRKLSACGFFLAQYAKVMSLVVDSANFDESDIESGPVRVANFLLDAIAQVGSGFVTTHSFDAVASDEAELAYILSVLNMGFCRRFSVIVKTLSSSFSSDQAQVRSRSLKSVVAMLETDSTLLDRDPTIADDVFKCASDDSAMVRDSALSLIAKFIIAKPALEQKGIKRLLECASDAKVGVQKRAIGHLKEIYLKDQRTLLKAAISRTFLRRTVDHENTVADLARKTLVEIWITPVLNRLAHSADLARTKIAIEELTSEIVSCVAHDTATLCPLLRKLFRSFLSADAKATSKIHELSVKIVESLFERTISNQDDRGPLMVLTAFSGADPQLIPPSHLGKLQPYLGDLKTENDLFVFKAVISIFSCVLPHLSATHKPLLLDTQNALMKVISSLGRRAELDTVMSCLQVIDGVLQNTMRLIKLAASIMLKIRAACASLKASQGSIPQLLKLLRIAGAMARYIDLEKYWQQFASEVKNMKERSVASYMAMTFLPMTQPDQIHQVRVLALESLGSLCQASPAQFNIKDIRKTFFAVFRKETEALEPVQRDHLQNVVLKIFEELYGERAQNKDDDNAENEEEQQELGKLGGNSRTRDGDSAISLITSSVVNDALAVALSTPSENALLATKTLSSISHQGLTHPKQSLAAFVALSTSPDERVTTVAHKAHQLLHQQHESVCEREYMSAIHESFDYQHKVLGDPTGARQPNYDPKLAACFEVVNTSGTKYVKKFLSGLISHISAKLSADDSALSVDQVLWTLFVIQNMAFFEFSKVDELLHTILQLELAYSKKSAEISQLLERALLPQPLFDGQGDSQLNGNSEVLEGLERPISDMPTVKRLAPLAATLTLMMEARSYLKRQYGVGRDVRTAISNNKQVKDVAKPPTKIHGITGERFWTRSTSVVELLRNEAGLLECCRNFVSLMSMDDEVHVEEEDPLGEPIDSLRPPEVSSYVRGNTPVGKKRKASMSAGGTPAKRGPGKQRSQSRRSMSVSSHDELGADFD